MTNMTQMEKDQQVFHLEAEAEAPPQSQGVGIDHAVDTQLEKRVMRRIDFRLLPILACLYTCALVDRSNIGVARISGLDGATQLDVGYRASVVILVFYVGYCLFEIPSNIAIKKFGAATWLGFIAVGWGLLTLGIGFSKNWQTLAVLRVCLGIFEAGLTPGCLYLIASWYPRYQLQTKVATFFMAAQFISSFANILAYGLIHIASSPEVDGWKYIYIVEGCLTITVGIAARLILVDFPESKRNTFLSAEERQVVLDRIIQERDSYEAEKVTWKVIRETLMDWPLWASSFFYMNGAVASYSFLIFLPIILRKGLGYSLELSFLLTAPPAAYSVIQALVMSKLADKFKMRGPFMTLNAALCTIGLAMIGFLDKPTPRYVGAFLGIGGTNSVIATAMAWAQNNMRSDARRSVGSGIQVAAAGIGGVYSALVFRQQDAPNYVPGIIATGVLMLLTVFVAPVVSYFLWRANKQADAGRRTIEGSLNFRYTW